MKGLALLALLVLLWAVGLAFGGPQSGADLTLFLSAQQSEIIPAARAATRLGDLSVTLALGLTGAAWLLWKRMPGRALLLVAALLSCRLLVELQKMGFDRARPDPHGHLVAVHSMAFPSGHSANSMAALLGIALFAVTDARLRPAAIALALTLSLLVGLSRLVLGVHWPSDVLGGWAFGALCVLLAARLAAGTPPNPPRFNPK